MKKHKLARLVAVTCNAYAFLLKEGVVFDYYDGTVMCAMIDEELANIVKLKYPNIYFDMPHPTDLPYYG